MEEINLEDITLTRYFMLYIENYETAVMADFHLGYEDVMSQKGIFLPKLQYPYIMELLERIFEKYDPKQIIIDGDLKHEFSRNMPQEWNEIVNVIDFILQKSKLIVIRGNHDNFLKSILKRRGLDLLESYTLGSYIFLHGHKTTSIPKNKKIIMAHEHPSITLRDEVYATMKLPCFLYSKELIVLPAVSLYATGTDITRNDFISPILKTQKFNFDVFGIDDKEGILPFGSIYSTYLE